MAVVSSDIVDVTRDRDLLLGYRSAGSWDIFVGEHTAGALWLSWALAKQLVAKGVRVRLYSEQLLLLAHRVIGLQSHLELQTIEGVTISRSARAAGDWPARTVLQILGAPLPSAYLHRLLHRSTESRWLQLDSMEGGRATTTPMTPLEEHAGCRSFLVQLGDGPNHGGYLHGSPTASGRGQGRSVDGSYFGKDWWLRLGLERFIREERFTVYVDASAARLIAPLLDMWRSARAAIRVIIEPPESRVAETYGFRTRDLMAGEVLPMMGPQVIELPLWPWEDTELVLCSADLAFIGDPVSCIRTAGLGTPLVPVLPTPLDDDTLLHWYCGGSPPKVAGLLAEFAQWGSDPAGLPGLWARYMGQWEEMRNHARLVARRIEFGLDLTETLLGTLCSTPGQISNHDD